ncbi:hypothetical protein M404DRAFT_1007437, partial [Pisolithus tinctorius Marx 270]
MSTEVVRKAMQMMIKSPLAATPQCKHILSAGNARTLSSETGSVREQVSHRPERPCLPHLRGAEQSAQPDHRQDLQCPKCGRRSWIKLQYHNAKYLFIFHQISYI